jgi:hypothetical protein
VTWPRAVADSERLGQKRIEMTWDLRAAPAVDARGTLAGSALLHRGDSDLAESLAVGWPGACDQPSKWTRFGLSTCPSPAGSQAGASQQSRVERRALPALTQSHSEQTRPIARLIPPSSVQTAMRAAREPRRNGS